MAFKEQFEKYAKECLSLDGIFNKSEEYYFGENNPLKIRLTANITTMREIYRSARNANKNLKPRDILPELKVATEALKKTIIEEFNIEGCSIGWENCANAACYTQMGNADIWGKSKNANDLKARISDIVTTDSTGFHYKNKKGIYYCIILGYNIFAADELFSVEEAVAVLLHELGHAMQHMVSSLNESIAISYYERLYRYYEPYLDYLKPEDRKEVSGYLKDFRAAIKRGDKAEIDRLGKEVIEAFEKGKRDKGFSDFTDDYIESQNNQYNPDWSIDTSKKESKQVEKYGKFNLFTAIKGLFSGLFSLIFSPLLLLSMFSGRGYKNKSNMEHVYKVFEEAADNFCAIYGVGPYQASALAKLAKLSEYRSGIGQHKIIEKIPLLDLIQSLKALSEDQCNCYAGYPTYPQRAINLYKAADFELKNNKDLSPEAKAELMKQIESYKKVYEEFVKSDSNKGWFYRKLAGLNRASLETAAKKDKFVDEHVLIPLKQKSDPNFKPDDVDD